MRYRVSLTLISLLTLTVTVHGQGIEGVVRDSLGQALAATYVAFLSPSFDLVDDGLTDAGGKFVIEHAPREGFLVVQPFARPNVKGMQTHLNQPRLIAMDSTASELDIRLPAAVSLVLEAYDREGTLMRWEDFSRNGVYGGQFMYATNLEDEAVAATCWPAHGDLTGSSSGPREKGLPALLVTPELAVSVNVMFWPVQGYGKLLLKADNAGAGYGGPQAGHAQVLLLNLELARTAVADLERRRGLFGMEGQGGIDALRQKLGEARAAAGSKEAAAIADAVLADALRLRDRLEVEQARKRIEHVRKGRLDIQITGPEGTDFTKYTVEARQLTHDFQFGIYEGSPYNAPAYEAAREAGFELATVLLGWNWTDNPKLKQQQINDVFGITPLNALGYRVKAHGVVWMQGYNILPEAAFKMDHLDLTKSVLEHQQSLLEVFGPDIALWEAINEPANTNVVNLPREEMIALMADAAGNIRSSGKATLVNSPHEFSYGGKYLVYNPDGTLKDGYPQTFSEFLRLAGSEGALEKVDVIGLQFYPGFHLNEDFGELEGPAYTPSYVLDTLERYSVFAKSIHITELSVPSSYGKDWISGYWREPWTEATQADYAEEVYTLAFSHPFVQCIGWWDVMDTKPSVITGGLMNSNGTPKAAFDRIAGLIEEWTTNETKNPDDAGVASFAPFGGTYEITVTSPEAKKWTVEHHQLERWHGRLEIEVGG